MLIMDDWNFDNAIRKIDFILLLCYEKGRLGNLALEEFKTAKKELIKECEDLDFATLDVGKYPKFREKYSVDLLPRVRIFKNGNYFDYHGEINAKHIVAWAHHALNIPIHIKLAKELEEIKKMFTVILGVFPNEKPEEELHTFIDASEGYIYDPKLALPRFAAITDAKVAKELGFTKNQVVVYKLFELGGKAEYKGDGKDLHKLMDFLIAESYPYVLNYDFDGKHLELTSTISKDYKHILFMDYKEKYFIETYHNFREASKNLHEKHKNVVFIYADSNNVPEKTMKGYFHIDVKKDLPCVRIVKKDKFSSKFIQPKADLSTSAIVKFTEDVVAGKLDRSIKSESQPSNWNSKAVKYIVGTTYESFIEQNKEKAIFINYHVPGDEKSDKVMVEFEKAADEMKGNETVVFAKMDVNLNDGEVGASLEVPTLTLHFASSTRRKSYNGERFTAEQLVKFVKTGGLSTPPDAYEKMKADMEEEEKKAMLKMEEEWVRHEEERKVEWEKEEEEKLKNAVTEVEGSVSFLIIYKKFI